MHRWHILQWWALQSQNEHFYIWYGTSNYIWKSFQYSTLVADTFHILCKWSNRRLEEGWQSVSRQLCDCRWNLLGERVEEQCQDPRKRLERDLSAAAPPLGWRPLGSPPAKENQPWSVTKPKQLNMLYQISFLIQQSRCPKFAICSTQISFSNQRDIHFQMPSWCQVSESVHQSMYVSQSKPETISILSQRSLHKWLLRRSWRDKWNRTDLDGTPSWRFGISKLVGFASNFVDVSSHY